MNIIQSNRTIKAVGDCMYPTIKAGDIVGLMPKHNFHTLESGGIYLVETSEEYNAMKVIRRVYYTDDRGHLVLHSDNPLYPDIVLPLQAVTGIYAVTGQLRFDAM